MHRFAPAHLVLPDGFAVGDLSDGAPGGLFGADPRRSAGQRAGISRDDIVALERTRIRKLPELPLIHYQRAARFVCGEGDS
jgi:hypothetical protein